MMAKQIQCLQQLLLLSTRVGVPFSAKIFQRHISSYLLRNQLNITRCRKLSEGCLIRNSVESSPRYQYICNRFCYSASSDHGETVPDVDLVSDSEGEVGAVDAVNEVFETKSFLSDTEWKNMYDLLQSDSRFENSTSFDGIIMKLCQRHKNMALADSYFEYLAAQNQELNLLALAYYLLLCGDNVETCGENKVLDLYKQLCSRVKVFDATLSEHACLALANTSEWKEAFKYLLMFKKLCSIPPKVYNALIGASFRNKEFDIGWQLLEAMIKENRDPNDGVFTEYVKQSATSHNKEELARILFHKFAEYSIYPKVPGSQKIMEFYREDMKWSGKYVKIYNDGVCPACSHKLEAFEIDEEAFLKLREEFISRVLVGLDIFQKTDPKEWQRFKAFVEREGPFATVVDGLNISYMGGPRSKKARIKALRDVVTKLKSTNQRGHVMVIGREHMESWSTFDLEAVKRRAKIFTLSNISQDDGFFIYAALQSGLGTQFVTSDLLRNHIYRLGDTSLRETFRRWQRKHQIFGAPSPDGIHLVIPPPFTTVAQGNMSSAWHIPYNDGSLKSYETPHTWLCLQSDPEIHRGYLPGRLVRDVPFECHAEVSNKPFHTNPKTIRMEPRYSKSNYIELNGTVPRSNKRSATYRHKESSPVELDIEFGKLKLDSKFGSYDKASSGYVNAKSHQNGFKMPRENLANETRSPYVKGTGSRSRMKEDMRDIIHNSVVKQREWPLHSRTQSDKRDLKSKERLVYKNSFKDT